MVNDKEKGRLFNNLLPTEFMKVSRPEPLLDPIKIKKMALLIRAVNHPIRQAILKLLHRKGSLNVTVIYKTIHEEQSVTSMHLAVLRKADLARTERQGRIIFYTVNKERLKQAQAAMVQLGF